MSEVSSIAEKQVSKSMDRIKELFDDILDECERAAIMYEMFPEVAGELMALITDELDEFGGAFYDTIVTKCIDQIRVNHSQGKLFDD